CGAGHIGPCVTAVANAKPPMPKMQEMVSADSQSIEGYHPSLGYVEDVKDEDDFDNKSGSHFTGKRSHSTMFASDVREATIKREEAMIKREEAMEVITGGKLKDRQKYMESLFHARTSDQEIADMAASSSLGKRESTHAKYKAFGESDSEKSDLDLFDRQDDPDLQSAHPHDHLTKRRKLCHSELRFLLLLLFFFFLLLFSSLIRSD
ncbi:hypothetical protein RFI_17486, partial [Reticulomyxa filosa]